MLAILGFDIGILRDTFRFLYRDLSLYLCSFYLISFYVVLLSRKLLGYESLDEMYSKMSCINYWQGIDKPMVFINAVDDPIVPPKLLEKVQAMTSKYDKKDENSNTGIRPVSLQEQKSTINDQIVTSFVTSSITFLDVEF